MGGIYFIWQHDFIIMRTEHESQSLTLSVDRGLENWESVPLTDQYRSGWSNLLMLQSMQPQ